jgi:hypothetical protein
MIAPCLRVVAQEHRNHPVVGVGGVALQGQAELAHVAAASHPLAGVPGLVQGRKKHGRQNGDYGYDHQKLD